MAWMTRAGAEEQQRLEEGVGEQMEHRRAVGADAGGEEHVAELRAGRISDHPLDVVLDRADGGGEDGGRGADVGDDAHARSALVSNIGDRRQTMNTPAVTMVAAWISALTGVGPSIASGSQVWRPSCADLPHRADEQQQAEQGHRVDAHAGEADGRSGHARRGGEDRRDRDGAEHQEGAEDAER